MALCSFCSSLISSLLRVLASFSVWLSSCQNDLLHSKHHTNTSQCPEEKRVSSCVCLMHEEESFPKKSQQTMLLCLIFSNWSQPCGRICHTCYHSGSFEHSSFIRTSLKCLVPPPQGGSQILLSWHRHRTFTPASDARRKVQSLLLLPPLSLLQCRHQWLQ